MDWACKYLLGEMAMVDKAWKRAERLAAKAFGVERNGRLGRYAGDTTPHPLFSIESKYRKTLPKVLTEGLAQAKAYDHTKTPLLVTKQRGMRGAIVSMWLKDFVDYLGEIDAPSDTSEDDGKSGNEV